MEFTSLMLQGVLLPQVYVIHAAYQSFAKRHMFMALVPGLYMIAA